MTRRNQIATVLFVVFLSYFGYQIYGYIRPANTVVVASGGARNFVPLAVENPALRMDLLDELKKFQYEGPRRNIFSAAPTPVAAAPQPVAPPASVAPPAQIAGPPPVVVPATFFGRVTDKRSGASRAFFSQGDDVYVLGLGEVLMNRFRLVQIGDRTAELEEIASGRRTTVTMEQPAS